MPGGLVGWWQVRKSLLLESEVLLWPLRREALSVLSLSRKEWWLLCRSLVDAGGISLLELTVHCVIA